MKQLYESEVLFQLMERDGFNIPSSVPPYESEIKAYLINQVKQAYPKLTDYEAEWLLYNYTKHLPAEFPISTVENTTYAHFENVVPFAYQSAILKGNTERINEHGFYQSDNSIFHLGYFEQGTYGGNVGGANKKIDDATRIRSINSYKVPQGTYSVELNSGFEGIIRGIDDYNNVLFSTEWSSSPTTTVTNDTTLLSVILRKQNQKSISVNDLEVAYKSSSGFDFANVTLTNVKMPVLKATGKNLFDENKEKSQYYITSNGEYVEDEHGYQYINQEYKVNGGETFSISFEARIGNNAYIRIAEFKGDNFIKRTLISSKKTLTVDIETNCIIFSVDANTDRSFTHLQIEQSTQATSYEPYKSNILSTSEEVELRGIGDVQDTLDCLTGEVTERIGEIMLDGSETTWVLNAKVEGYTRANIPNIAKKDNVNNNTKIKTMSDTLPSIAFNDMYIGDGIGIATNEYGNLYIRLKTSDLISDDINGIKDYLSKNNVTVQYLLKTESIKTVDLTTLNESGETVYFMPLEGIMNVSTSSETIQPTFDMNVPVEATTQNLASFINMEMEE